MGFTRAFADVHAAKLLHSWCDRESAAREERSFIETSDEEWRRKNKKPPSHNKGQISQKLNSPLIE